MTPCETCKHKDGWRNNACTKCLIFKAYEPEIQVPQIVIKRWQEAIDADSMRNWYALSKLVSTIWVNASLHAPESELTGNLYTLADVAWQHYQDAHPKKELAIS